MSKVAAPLAWITSGNQLRPTLARQVVPGPLEEHQELIVEADQVVDVHKQPQEPGRESGQTQSAEICHPGVTADDRQIALVDVMELSGGFPPQPPADGL